MNLSHHLISNKHISDIVRFQEGELASKRPRQLLDTDGGQIGSNSNKDSPRSSFSLWLSNLCQQCTMENYANSHWINKIRISRKMVVVASFPRARVLGECLTNHSPPALFLKYVYVAISSRTLIPLFRPGSVHSGTAS